MRSLGASRTAIATLFYVETGILALAAGTLGYLAGSGLAAWLDSLLSSSSPGAPAFQLGVNQFKAKGVTYRDVLESARVFSRAGEGRGFA